MTGHQGSPESLTASQRHLLRDVQVFSRIRVYGGILPLRLVSARDPAEVEDLVVRGYVERKKLCLTCGSDAPGLALTAKGGELLIALSGEETPEPEQERT